VSKIDVFEEGLEVLGVLASLTAKLVKALRSGNEENVCEILSSPLAIHLKRVAAEGKRPAP
jgi:hypothetical protein